MRRTNNFLRSNTYIRSTFFINYKSLSLLILQIASNLLIFLLKENLHFVCELDDVVRSQISAEYFAKLIFEERRIHGKNDGVLLIRRLHCATAAWCSRGAVCLGCNNERIRPRTDNLRRGSERGRTGRGREHQ